MTAQFIVTSDPGTFVQGVGFVRPGEMYTAPPGHVPSRTVLPVNAEAVAELKKLKDQMLAVGKAYRDEAAVQGIDADDKKLALARAKHVENQAKAIKSETTPVERKAPVVEKALSLEQLGHAMAGSDAPGEKQQNRKL
jgi:hypothetical protein